MFNFFDTNLPHHEWKNAPLPSMDWKKLPDNRFRPLKWYEVTKIRDFVSKIFITLSCVTPFACAFIASPIICLSTLIGATALGIAGIFLHMRKNHPLDPDFRMAERLKVKNETIDCSPNVKELRLLVSRYIITFEEMQVLLYQDIYFTDYTFIIKKHGNEIFNHLDKRNLNLFKQKFLCYIETCEFTLPDVILNCPANKHFRITLEDLEPILRKNSKRTSFTDLASKASPYVNKALKFASDTLIPSPLRNAGQLAMGAVQLASQGKPKEALIFTANATTQLLFYSTKEMMKTLYPEASEAVKMQMLSEKLQ